MTKHEIADADLQTNKFLFQYCVAFCNVFPHHPLEFSDSFLHLPHPNSRNPLAFWIFSYTTPTNFKTFSTFLLRCLLHFCKFCLYATRKLFWFVLHLPYTIPPHKFSDCFYIFFFCYLLYFCISSLQCPKKSIDFFYICLTTLPQRLFSPFSTFDLQYPDTFSNFFDICPTLSAVFLYIFQTLAHKIFAIILNVSYTHTPRFFRLFYAATCISLHCSCCRPKTFLINSTLPPTIFRFFSIPPTLHAAFLYIVPTVIVHSPYNTPNNSLFVWLFFLRCLPHFCTFALHYPQKSFDFSTMSCATIQNYEGRGKADTEKKFVMRDYASIAQLAERALRKRTVVGSIPTGGLCFLLEISRMLLDIIYSAINTWAQHAWWPAAPMMCPHWVHSSVVRAADCRSAGPWFKSGCALLRAAILTMLWRLLL